MSDDGDRPNGIIRAILNLLAEMDERDERSGRGHWSGDRTSVDYSISVGSLDDAMNLGPPEDRGPAWWDEPPEARDRGTGGTDEWAPGPITTRTYGDEMLVAADLPDVRAENLDVAVNEDEGTVTIDVDGDRMGEVPIDDGDWSVAEVSVNNDVVEVLLTRE